MTTSNEDQLQQACRTANLHVRRAIHAVAKARTLGWETVDIDELRDALMSAKLAIRHGLLSMEYEGHGQLLRSDMCALLTGRVLRD